MAAESAKRTPGEKKPGKAGYIIVAAVAAIIVALLGAHLLWGWSPFSNRYL